MKLKEKAHKDGYTLLHMNIVILFKPLCYTQKAHNDMLLLV